MFNTSENGSLFALQSYSDNTTYCFALAGAAWINDTIMWTHTTVQGSLMTVDDRYQMTVLGPTNSTVGRGTTVSPLLTNDTIVELACGWSQPNYSVAWSI
jgi:hypothetical protein